MYRYILFSYIECVCINASLQAFHKFCSLKVHIISIKPVYVLNRYLKTSNKVILFFYNQQIH